MPCHRAPNCRSFLSRSKRFESARHCDLPFEQFCYIPGPMGAGSQLGHRPHLSLFRWRQAVEAYAEEAGVELCKCLLRCDLSVCWRNGRLSCHVPTVFPPLLQEVWIAVRMFQNDSDRSGPEFDALLFSRHAQSSDCRLFIELVNGNEFKQSLRVGFGSAGLSQKLWQPRGDHGHSHLWLS